MMSTEITHAEQNAASWLAEIGSKYDEAGSASRRDDQERMDAIEEWVRECPLSVEVREGWHEVGDAGELAEFCILLSTGGPALRLIGGLNQYGEPGDATERLALEFQDWGTPWTAYPLSEQDRDALAWFAQRFYYEI